MTKQTRSFLVDIERRFKNANIQSPRFDAEVLVAFILKVERKNLGLINDISDDQEREIEKLVEKRVRRIPLQHLVGEQGFRYLNLKVGKGVFIPRPETEILVEAVIRYLKEIANERKKVIDFCAGSGAIALAIATECANVDCFAIEKSEEAFSFLKENYQKYEEEIKSKNSTLTLVNQDVKGEVQEIINLNESFDVVVSNPPYIPEKMIPKEIEVKDHEPEIALYGGKDGLEIVRVVIEKGAMLLKSGGFIGIEHADVQGNINDEASVPFLLQQNGNFKNIQDRKDLNGLPRFCMGIKK